MPFTIEQFLDVFRRYNETVWPAQGILLALAGWAVMASLRTRGVSRVPALVLAVLWLWVGVVYHLMFFRAINPAAVLFGTAFVIQAGMFAWLAVRKPAPHFRVQRNPAGVLGAMILAFAIIVYPALGWLAGERYPATPTFGLPCPTTLYTFGLLLWARPSVPTRVLVIPVLWSLVATMAALQLGMVQDVSLPVVAVLATAVMLKRGGQAATVPAV